MTPENLRCSTIHIKHLSDVPVSKNWYKTVTNLYQNSYIYNFRINLTQFYINFSRKEHKISYMHCSTPKIPIVLYMHSVVQSSQVRLGLMLSTFAVGKYDSVQLDIRNSLPFLPFPVGFSFFFLFIVSTL